MGTDWQMSVTEVLKRPLFQHAEVVAGKRGLARTIRWVHVLETAANGEFLNGGELILSTGMGFGEDAERRLAYLTELIRRKAVGLCIELGTYIPDIPTDMRELADHHDFPLIVFHRTVRFVDITLDLHERIVNQQLVALRRLEKYSRDLQQLSLQAQGINRLLQHFQTEVHTQVFYYPLEGTPLYVPLMPQAVQQEINQLLHERLRIVATDSPISGAFSISERKHILYQPILAMGHILAYVGVVLYERESDEFLHLTLDYTVSAMAQILMRSMFAEEQALDSDNRILDDLLANRVVQEEQVRALLGIHYELDSPVYYAMIVQMQGIDGARLERSFPPHELISVFRSVLSQAGYRCYIRCKGHRFYILLMAKNRRAEGRLPLDRALQEMERISKNTVVGADFIAGVSRPSTLYALAYQHFHEAEQIVRNHSIVPSRFFSDLGVYRILFQLPDDETLNALITDYLYPLITYDQQHGTQLLYTLRIYLEKHQSKQDTAEHLYIHRQTLYHRLQKIRDCIGDSLSEPNHRLCLEVAFHAYDLLQKK